MGFLFWALFGAAIVGIPVMVDRLLKGRVSDGIRMVLGLLVAALIGVAFVLIARMLSA